MSGDGTAAVSSTQLGKRDREAVNDADAIANAASSGSRSPAMEDYTTSPPVGVTLHGEADEMGAANSIIKLGKGADGTPQQCVFIEKNGTTKPPDYTIPFNTNSTRAYSKKNRVYVLRDFLHRTYPAHMASDCDILDVAGGKGVLSWVLQNMDGINSVIADPRIPNHRSIIKSVKFLLDHPEEAKIRAVEGLPTHQPLAKLLVAKNTTTTNGTPNEMGENQNVQLVSPKFMRIHVDNALVHALENAFSSTGEGLECWDKYWQEERQSVESNQGHYGGTAPKQATAKIGDAGSSQITDSRIALEVFRSLDLIVGFHPDQATEATIDLALLLKVPFAVVPCCVFPSEFPNRTLDGQRVRTHNALIEYLCRKHRKIRREKLSFVETETAKSTVLYMLKDDF